MASLNPPLTGQGHAAGPPPRGKTRVHSVLVRILRWLLPAIMLAVVLALAALVAVHAVRRHADATKEASSPIRMVNPHFFGRDNQGRAFTLAAHQASRDEASFQRVLLVYPSVILGVGGPHPSMLTADHGVYQEDTRLLYLQGHVRANNAQASRFATDQAIVDTRTGAVKGAGALAGQTAAGNVKSGSFDVYDKGNRVVFTGGVHARLNQH